MTQPSFVTALGLRSRPESSYDPFHSFWQPVSDTRLLQQVAKNENAKLRTALTEGEIRVIKLL